MNHYIKFLTVIGIILVACILYLLIWPVPIEPVAWKPAKSPVLEGIYEPNNILSNVKRIELKDGFGPEDVDVDSQGRVYGGLQDGRIIRFSADLKESEVFADTGGRPLGLHFDLQENLIVADAYNGLLSISPTGDMTVLTTESEGLPFLFTNDLDIAADGVIYFSDASFKYTQEKYKADAMEHQSNGRLLAYDPKSKSTRTLLKKLFFANGVAVSPDQSFVLVNETWEYRVIRYWLTGEKKGKSEIFIDTLPGFPDGISSNGKGVFWLALASPRNPMIDSLADKPFMRKVIMRLPKFMQPAPIRYAFVLGLDYDGNVIHNLQEPSGTPYSVVTSVQAHRGMLYLGSLHENAIGRIPEP